MLAQLFLCVSTGAISLVPECTHNKHRGCRRTRIRKIERKHESAPGDIPDRKQNVREDHEYLHNHDHHIILSCAVCDYSPSDCGDNVQGASCGGVDVGINCTISDIL